jgi:hypothetical protein
MVQGFKVERFDFSGNIEVVYVLSRRRSIPKISRWETTKIFSFLGARRKSPCLRPKGPAMFIVTMKIGSRVQRFKGSGA